ncbi:hypothetical protein BKA66DRAFT_441717 [Pyrenochaeta sp. MPI-SDFR-AT-0127]|nr:hypothetical protein BKA66DRAFT_441717 [Pyrenochaeta sp. MPI-SDFR-AT-0127]
MPTPPRAGEYQSTVRLSRWWFALEVCPLLTGTLGPLATGFSACSLTTGWTHIAVQNQDGIHTRILENPTWFIVLNAITVGSGFISSATNFFCVWSKISFVICTVGLLIQSSILISLLIATRHSASWLKMSGNYHFTQAYHYATISAVLSIATLVCVFLHGFGLINKYYSVPPRMESTRANLFRQFIALIAYLLLGAALYAHVENWSFLDSVFWADFTLLTIGLGGVLTPKTAIGRGLLLPYAIGGIALVALFVISVRRLLLKGRDRLTNHWVELSRERLEKSLLEMAETSVFMDEETTFNLVRRIPLDAERRCSRTAYALSVFFILVLLLGGASIFNLAEKDNSWTYGISVYFSYVSLLTIGYGDYIPNSESCKPFFVVWSLFSVPILTIFINNSVDTVYGTFRGLAPFFLRLINRRRRYMMPVPRSPESARMPLGSGFRAVKIAEGGITNNELDSKRAGGLPKLTLPEQGEPSQPQGKMPRRIPRDQTRLHCQILAKELGVVINDIMPEPGKKYSYEEWAHYIELMGRATWHKRFNTNTQQDGELRSRCNHTIRISIALSPRRSINWASQGTPILLQNESKWISSWLSSELVASLNVVASHDA